MDHFRLRKYRGTETWMRVREAYETGESGPSVARRFDVGLANLRKKSREEGWSRKDIARRLDSELEPVRVETARLGAAPDPAVPPLDPEAVLEGAIQRAGGLLAQGRAVEAQTLIRSAEGLARLTGAGGHAGGAAGRASGRGRADDQTDVAEPGLSPEARVARQMDEYDADVIDQATKLAWAMLMDKPSEASARHSAFMYHWRARHLGPEATACDFAYAVNTGSAPRYFDSEGRLRPLPEPITPLGMMVDQYLRLSRAIDAKPDWRDVSAMDLTYDGPIQFSPPSDDHGIG